MLTGWVAAKWLGGVPWRFGKKFLVISPGIRPSGVPSDDHFGPVTPGEAIRAGADFIVVGRPIMQAPDPGVAAAAIIRQMGEDADID